MGNDVSATAAAVAVLLLSPSFLLGVRVIFGLSGFASVLALGLVVRPRARRVCAAWATTAAVVVAASIYFHLSDPFHSRFPGSFYVWGAAPVLACTMAVAAWNQSRWPIRVLSVLSVPVCLVFAGATINDHYAYFPTVESLLGRAAHDQVSGQAVHEASVDVRRTRRLPSHGLVFSLNIPPTTSHFNARGTYIYLPPAWFASPHPSLPAVMLIAGSPGTPADWTRSGRADTIADDFAARHHGRAPILVMPDPNGSPFGDTECVDGPRGHAETYLVDDVRPFVIAHYHVIAATNAWAIAGLSEGGTCALTLALRHPDDFSAFVDFGGDRAPDPGRSATRHSLFGPSYSTWASYQPTMLLARRSYPELAGWFEVALGDRGPRHAADELGPILASRGVNTCLVERQGQHNFTFFHDGLEHALPWLAVRLGLTLPGDDACAAAGGHHVVPEERRRLICPHFGGRPRNKAAGQARCTSDGG